MFPSHHKQNKLNQFSQEDSFKDFLEGDQEEFISQFNPKSGIVKKPNKYKNNNQILSNNGKKKFHDQVNYNDAQNKQHIYEGNFFGDKLKLSEVSTQPRIKKFENSTEKSEKKQKPIENEEEINQFQESKLENNFDQEDDKKYGRNKDDWRQMDQAFVNIYEGKQEQSRKEQQRKQMEEKIIRTKQLLSGKVSTLWLFVVRDELSTQDLQMIKSMYNGLTDKFLVPLCKNCDEAKIYLDLPNSFFKIVSDLVNMEDVLNFRIRSTVTQFYIYNQRGEEGVSAAIDFKSKSKKVKGIYTKLQKIFDHAGQELQNEIKIFRSKTGEIKMKKTDVKFPSFLKLSGEDKTEATHYRGNLYGARNLPIAEKPQYFQEFLSLVKEKYLASEEDKKRQQRNYDEYTSINHKIMIESIHQASQILKFYVRQSFYYRILNSMLRTLKTTQQFKPCVLPFNETYNSVKLYYKEKLKRLNRKIPHSTLYRGARMRTKDFESLKQNSYIQMFGFMSTSKNFERASEFADQSGYMFIIDVPEMCIPQEFDKYDHGFVDINQNNLAPENLKKQEEVLFNALNVYKVNEIVIDRDGYTRIHLSYGVIFELLSKDKSLLTEDEKCVLLNYEYCTNMLSKIQDRGDVHFLANQFEEAKDYYTQKLRDQYTGSNLCKLANVHQQCGELQEAERRAQQSLKRQMEELDRYNQQRCMKVYEIHVKNAQIKQDDENMVDAEDQLLKAINYLQEDDDFKRAQKYRQMGEMKFKRGEIREAEKDLEHSETIFIKILNKADEKRKQIHKKYCCVSCMSLLNEKSKEQLEKEKEQDLQKIDLLQKEIESKRQSIHQELVKVNRSMKQVADLAQDKQKYQQCVKKAQQYIQKLSQNKPDDPHEKAKINVLSATVQNFTSFKESTILIKQAISIQEDLNPFNEEVGEYSAILATFQKEDIEKFVNPKGLMKLSLEKEVEKIQYKQEQQKEQYEECRKNYEKAINIMLYNNKTKASPQVMNLKNQVGELDFNQSKYEKSYSVVKQVSTIKQSYYHTQIAKSNLILAKISFSRGEQKNSFETLKKAKDILRKAIVKRQEQKYIHAYKYSQIYLQLKIQRAKVYLKQLNHDSCLKDLNDVKSLLNQKLQKQSHSILADIYELEGQNAGMNQSVYEFDKYFSQAISLREKQIGVKNLPNALAYCNYAKYLIMFKDFKKAQECLQKAVQIFSCFTDNHPIKWILIYCYGILSSAKESKKQKSLQLFYKCLQHIENQFDKSNITYTKIKLHYARELRDSGKSQQAIKQLRVLRQTLQDNLRKSQNRTSIDSQEDDEKITVKKMLYSSLKQSYRQIQNLNESRNGINECQVQLNNLKNTFRLSD